MVKAYDNINVRKANLVKAYDNIAMVISKMNIVASVNGWVLVSNATRHSCANKSTFISYTPLEEGKKTIYLSDSRATQVLKKEKSSTNSHLARLYF